MTAPAAPTPNNMPGAQPSGEPNPQMAQPVSTAPPAPAAPAPQAQPEPTPQTPPAQPQTPPAKDDTKQETDWKSHARTWEQRARENEEKAKKFEEWEATQRTQAENDRLAREAAEKEAREAKAELARERVARETGVAPQLLSGGTEDEMRASAQIALEWRGPAAGTPAPPPPPQTAAVSASSVSAGAVPMATAPNGVQQLTIEQFRALPPAEQMQAVRAGQCENLGVGKPKTQRRMGNEVELSAHGGRT